MHHTAEEAARDNIPYVAFLDKLLQEELTAKTERFIKMKTRMAHLPYRKTLQEFDFAFQPSIEERLWKPSRSGIRCISRRLTIWYRR
ncbi:ATP-binding protein [Paenibacillaceae bacterium WGS1546]|uniref:ATP-binding protein n=1 Tax=Cohnella sp. WGS1546 TaxID=3366810 RepID=UPI00372D647F